MGAASAARATGARPQHNATVRLVNRSEIRLAGLRRRRVPVVVVFAHVLGADILHPYAIGLAVGGGVGFEESLIVFILTKRA